MSKCKEDFDSLIFQNERKCQIVWTAIFGENFVLAGFGENEG